MKRLSLWSAVSITSSALIGFPAISFSAPALEEVIVTAEKREESIQDVPISIVAFSQDRLEKLGISDIKDLAAKVPNVLINEFTGSSTTVRLFIRGIGQNDVQVTQDPSVALYMDGVYIGSSVGTAFETADLQRIEVLRGPQGTLYGRNATGGAINIITRRADPSGLTFKQKLDVGSENLFRSTSIVNLPLTETTAVKFAYTSDNQDGWVENEGNGEDWGIVDRDTFTADFHWDIGSELVMNYKYEYYSVKDTSRLSQALGFDPSAPVAGLVVFENPAVDANGVPVEATSDRLDKATSFDEEQKGDDKINAHTLHLDWELSEMLALRSITAYRDVNAFTQNAQSPTASLQGIYTIVNGLPETSFNQFTQEFQLLGDMDSLTWVAGLFYYEDESEESNPGNSSGSEAIPPGELVDYTSTENKSIAIYGQATWTPASLQDRWHFTLGGRYSYDNRKAHRDNSRVAFGFAGTPTGVPAFTGEYDENFGKFNPSFTVEYALNAFSNLYAKVDTAYKAGGTSQRSTSLINFQEGFDEEEVVAYEVGYKGDLADSRVRLNAAVFYMEYDNYQQSVVTGSNAGERDFVNIPDADISGLELDLSVAITDQLVGTISYGYLDTGFGPKTITYLTQDPTSADGVSPVTETLTDDLALAAAHSATIAIDYTRTVSAGIFSANINAQYQERTNSSVTEPTGYMDDRTLVGVNMGLSEIELGAGYGQLKVSMWGKNLLDQEYFVGSVRQTQFELLGLGGGVGTFGDPRTYGVTLEYEFF